MPDTEAPLTPIPLVKDKLTFLGSDAGIVTCIEAATGTVVWRNRVGGSNYGSLTWVNVYLYCVDRCGTVLVVTGTENKSCWEKRRWANHVLPLQPSWEGLSVFRQKPN